MKKKKKTCVGGCVNHSSICCTFRFKARCSDLHGFIMYTNVHTVLDNVKSTKYFSYKHPKHY